MSDSIEGQIEAIEGQILELRDQIRILRSDKNLREMRDATICVGDMIEYLSRFPEETHVLLSVPAGCMSMRSPSDIFFYASKSGILALYPECMFRYKKEFKDVILESFD
jgi:hypothetical protein